MCLKLCFLFLNVLRIPQASFLIHKSLACLVGLVSCFINFFKISSFSLLILKFFLELYNFFQVSLKAHSSFLNVCLIPLDLVLYSKIFPISQASFLILKFFSKSLRQYFGALKLFQCLFQVHMRKKL
jgi:hypothetical protein